MNHHQLKKWKLSVCSHHKNESLYPYLFSERDWVKRKVHSLQYSSENRKEKFKFENVTFTRG